MGRRVGTVAILFVAVAVVDADAEDLLRAGIGGKNAISSSR